MRKVILTKDYAVFDNFIPLKDWDFIRRWVMKAPMEQHQSRRTWRKLDGPSFRSPRPFLWNTKCQPAQAVFQHLNNPAMRPFFGADPDFELRPYRYPSGSSISWHNDPHMRMTFILYTHSRWDPNWGGNLLIKTGDDRHGVFIEPKPNRIVLISKHTSHSVTPIRTGVCMERESIAGGVL